MAEVYYFNDVNLHLGRDGMAYGEYRPDCSNIKKRMAQIGMLDASGAADVTALTQKIREISGNDKFSEQSVRNWLNGKGIHKKNLMSLGEALEIGIHDLILDAPQEKTFPSSRNL